MTALARIGMLTPSSNTVLEPATAAMLAGLPAVSAHFARFRVTEIALSASALGQFEGAGMLQAAALLADARCDVIAWNGTSAGWLGAASDHALCEAIAAATGARACTSVLALHEMLATTGARRIGLVTPYRSDVQARIVANYAGMGIEVAAEVHLQLQDNYSFAEVAPDALARAMQAVAGASPDAIVVLCTNLRGAAVAARQEAALGIPVYDSVAATLWKALALCGQDPAQVTGWGSGFAVPVRAA